MPGHEGHSDGPIPFNRLSDTLDFQARALPVAASGNVGWPVRWATGCSSARGLASFSGQGLGSGGTVAACRRVRFPTATCGDMVQAISDFQAKQTGYHAACENLLDGAAHVAVPVPERLSAARAARRLGGG